MMTKDDIIADFENSGINNKYIWFSEYFLNLTFDDDELADSIGKYLYEMCLDIHEMKNDRFYPINESYKVDMMYKNLLEGCGLCMDYGVSYRQAWFDYYSNGRLIKNEETMDWLLRHFMMMHGESDE